VCAKNYKAQLCGKADIQKYSKSQLYLDLAEAEESNTQLSLVSQWLKGIIQHQQKLCVCLIMLWLPC